MVMAALGDIFGVGGGSVVSRLMGNRKKEDSRRISALCFYGAPLLLAGNVPLNLLRTEGMAKASMAGSIVGSVVNMILDPIFILGFQDGRSRSCNRDGDRKCGVLGRLRSVLPKGRMDYDFSEIFSFSSLPLIGYNYGQKNYDRLKKILKFIYSFEISLAVGVGILMAVFAQNLIALFMEDAAIVFAGTQILRCQLSGVVFTAIILISTCVFQAIGNGKATLAVTVGRQLVIFIPVLFVANYFVGYRGILFAQPLSDLLSVVLIAILLKRNKKRILGDE